MKVSEYIEKVVQQIKYKPIREEIAEEIKNHVEESKENYIHYGLEERQAEEKAILQMGDAEEVGKKLNKIHRPKLDWKLVLLICVCLGFGFLVAFIRQKRFDLLVTPHESMLSYGIILLIGIIMAIFLYFMDYRKLLKYSKQIFAITCFFVTIAILFGGRMNGRAYFFVSGFSIAPAAVAMPLFMIAFVGFLQNIDMEKKIEISLPNRKFGLSIDLLKLIGLSGISIVLFLLLPSISSAFIMGMVYMILATLKIVDSSLKNTKRDLALLWGIPTILGVLLIVFLLLPFNPSYFVTRVINSFYPEYDPMGGGYIGMQQQKILDTANVFGKADDIETGPLNLFGEGTNYAFIVVLAYYGWAIAIGMVVSIIALNAKLIMNSRKIKDNYGKMLICGVACMFILQSLCNILMNLNLGVQSNFSIPLISYGKMDLVVNLCLLSIVLSIYRKKDISITQVRHTSVIL